MKDRSPLQGRDVVYLGSADWDARTRTSTHHIAKQLSRNNRVLYVDSIGQRTPQASARHAARVVGRLKRFFEGPKIISDNLIHFSPLAVPLHRFAAVRELNRRLVVSSLRRVCRQIGFRKPVLIVFPPQMFFLPGSLGETVAAYYCIDEYSAFPGADRESILEMERRLIDKTDLTFVSAERLAERRRKQTPDVFYIPHGLDFERFARDPSNGGRAALFERFPDLKRPVVGFFGSIAEWVDQDLIAHAARRRPDWSFVFLGEERVDVSVLRKLPNVRFGGYIEYDVLPELARDFDAAVIPFVEDEITANVNPIKLRECLALGMPLVSTPMEEVEKFGGLVYTASGAENFLAALDRALKEDSPERRRERREAVRGDAWSERAARVGDLLLQYEARRAGKGTERR